MFIPIWVLVCAVIANIGIVAFLVYDWFVKNYTVVDLETWNKIAVFYNENYSEEPQELAGGVGFFREQLIEECDDEEIEDDE